MEIAVETWTQPPQCVELPSRHVSDSLLLQSIVFRSFASQPPELRPSYQFSGAISSSLPSTMTLLEFLSSRIWKLPEFVDFSWFCTSGRFCVRISFEFSGDSEEHTTSVNSDLTDPREVKMSSLPSDYARPLEFCSSVQVVILWKFQGIKYDE